MNEYVSLQAVLDIASQYCPDDDGSCSKADIDPREMLDEIEALPSADVQLVKHGSWEYEDTIGGMKHYHCTNCDNNGSACIADENQILWWEFCPRCGARMDGDVK